MDETSSRNRLASRSAQALIFGAGIVTLLNATFSTLPNVNAAALSVTGLVTIAASFAMPLLPWSSRARTVSLVIVVAALGALVGADHWHHYSRNPSAIAVYPVFFIVVIAWTGLTQPRGTATVVAVLSGGALAWLLESGGAGAAAMQCIAVTVPAAAVLGEVISWAHGRALTLGRLDANRRTALEALVTGASSLHGALTPEESVVIVIDIANAMFRGDNTRYEPALPTAVDTPAEDDVHFDTASSALRIRLRGHTGVIGTVRTTVLQPDTFTLDSARLFGQQIGGRLEQLRVIVALTDAATHDALTGIANRRAAALTISTIEPGDAVFLLDIDLFKAVNDNLGHKAGDEVLAQFGDYLRTFTRPSDFVARYGGEEFLVICRAVDVDGAQHLADRLLDGWRSRRPLVTFSIGFEVHAGDTPTEITIEHADMALYQAKRDGRDRACRYAGAVVDDGSDYLRVVPSSGTWFTRRISEKQ